MRRLLPEPACEIDDLHAEYAVPDRALGRGWHVRSNFVSSADGAMNEEGVTAGLSTPADRSVFATLRDLADVVLVGAGTARAEGYGPARPGPRRAGIRRDLGLSDAPAIAVVSRGLDLDPTAELFTAGDANTLVVTHAAAPADRAEALSRVCEVVVAGSEAVDLAAAVRALAERGLRRILCEGGPHLFASMLAADLVDEACLTFAPLLTGPGAGRIVAGAPLHEPRPLRLTRLVEDGGTLLLTYGVDRPGA